MTRPAERMMFSINIKLLPAKAHYFAFYAALAGVLPFLVRIMKDFGASPSLVGYIYSTQPFIVMAAKGIFGAIADKYQQKKLVLMISVIMMTCAFSVMNVLPTILEYVDTNNSDCGVNGNGGYPQPGRWTPVRCKDERIVEWCWYNNFVINNNSSNIQQPICQSTCRTTSDVLRTHLCQYFLENCEVKLESGSPFNSNSTTVTDLNVISRECRQMKFELWNSSSCVDYSDHFDHCEVAWELLNSNLLFKEDTVSDEFNYKIVLLWCLMGIAYIGMGVGVSMADTIVLDLLEKKQNFGRERLWGAVGWGSFSIATGQLIDSFSSDEYLNFTPGMVIVLGYGILDIFIIRKIKVTKTEKPKRVFKDVGTLFLEPEVALFTLIVFIVGCLTSVLWTFLLVYLNELHASQLLIGLTMAVQCFFGEIPFFFVSNWFLKKLGHYHSMTLVLIFFAIRLVCYSLIDNPWWVLPIELTQGITYGIFFSALATYGNLKAHPSINSTVQGILQGTFEGIGIGVGSLVSGIAYEFFGAKRFFLFTGCLAGGLALIIGIILTCLLHYRKGKSNNQMLGVGYKGEDDQETEMSNMISGNEAVEHNNLNYSNKVIVENGGHINIL